MKKTINPFVKKYIAKADKTEKEVRQERAEEFVELATIDIQDQIGLIDSEIKRLEVRKNKQQSLLAIDKKAFNESKYEIPYNASLNGYVATWNEGKEKITLTENQIAHLDAQIKAQQTQKAEFEEMLKVFQGE